MVQQFISPLTRRAHGAQHRRATLAALSQGESPGQGAGQGRGFPCGRSRRAHFLQAGSQPWREHAWSLYRWRAANDHDSSGDFAISAGTGLWFVQREGGVGGSISHQESGTLLVQDRRW